jgi:hypothetical protein
MRQYPRPAGFQETAMPHSCRVFFAGLVLIGCCTWSARAQDPSYKVRLTRPAKVGDQAQILGGFTHEIHSVLSIGGQAQAPVVETRGLSYEGRSRVLAVDADGQVTRLMVTFDKCALTTPKGPSEAVPKGGVVTIELRDGQPTFELQGGHLSDGARQALKTAEFVVPPGPSDDELFGTDQEQKVGGHWPIHTAAMAKDLCGKDMKVDAKDIHGQATLAGVKTVHGVPCLGIVVEVGIDRATPSGAGLPAGLKFDRCVIKNTMTAVVPEDPSLSVVKRGLTMTMDMDARSGADGPPFSLKLTTQVEMHDQAIPIK